MRSGPLYLFTRTDRDGGAAAEELQTDNPLLRRNLEIISYSI